MPLASSKAIFEDANVVRTNRAARNNILKGVAKVVKIRTRPILSKKNKLARMEWARNYMICDFKDVFLTGECQAMLDGPDDFGRGCLAH